MMNLLASAIAGVGMLFGGLFGHPGPMHPNMGSTTPPSTTGTYKLKSSSEILGKVVSIASTTLMVSAHGQPGSGDSATTTYSVDASAAKISEFEGKGQASSTPITLSDIKVGDIVLAIGTLSGTSMEATRVVDGLPSRYMRFPFPVQPRNGTGSTSSTTR